MIRTQYINLNMIPSGVMPVLYCSQYDVGRPLGMVVYNGAESVDLSGYTVTIEGTRSDNTPITAAVTTEGNIGAFATTATMTNKADQYLMKLVLTDASENRVASLAFVLCVTPKTMDENAESIEEDRSLYQQYTGTVQALIADIRSQLTDLKNQLDVQTSQKNYVTMPIYIGDFMTDMDYLPSAVVKKGTYFYVFNPHTQSYNMAHNSGIGELRVFDINNNVEVTSLRKDILIGHANSACYNPNTDRFYVVPADTYANGQNIPISKIYEFTTDFNTMVELNTPTLPKAVTYDHVAGKMYYCSRTNYIYVYNGGSWDFVARLDLSGIDVSIYPSYGYSYNQDFAVYDGFFYLSAPAGNILYGILKDADTGEPKILEHYLLSNVDVNGVYRIGELEGFEFDDSGYFYACQYTNLDAYNKTGFVTEILLGQKASHSSSMGVWGTTTVNVRSVTLSNSTQQKFSLQRGELRSISQLSLFTQPGTNIVIPEGEVVTDDRIVYIDQDVSIDIYGELRVRKFILYSGIFALTAHRQTARLSATSGSTAPLINNLSRSTEIKLIGEYALNIDLGSLPDEPGNFINFTYGFPLCIVRKTPVSVGAQKIYFGSWRRPDETFSFANMIPGLFKQSTLLAQGDFAGYISSGAKIITFTIPLKSPVIPGYTVTCTPSSARSTRIYLRGVNGYVDNVTEYTLSDFTISFDVLRSEIEVYLSKKTQTAFNVLNNTPVIITLWSLELEFTYT